MTTTTTTTTATMQDIKNSLTRLSALETEFANSKFLVSGEDTTSPRGIDNTALIQRYEQARDLYLQRRLENLLVDHIATFDGETIDLPETEENADLIERNEQALRTLQASLATLNSNVDQLRHTRDAVQSRRQELERMLHDLNQDNDDGDDDAMDEDDASSFLDPTALEQEQAHIETLQQRKRLLQDQLEQLELQAKQAQERARAKEEQVQLLQQESSASEDGAELQRKLQELVEMKDFYDSLRQVLEELGGVKIVSVQESTQENTKTPQLCLSLLFYQDYPVQIILQVYRKVYLKLVDAQWTTTNEEPLMVQAATQDYALPLEPLQDLVQTAISTLGPPHDLRFVVRETLARIRITQTRVEQLAELRLRHIMKLYGNQVTCSLNEGIIIVMRLYEKYVVLDDLVGINGWDHAATKQLRTNVQSRLETEYAQEHAEIALFGSKITPLVIVELVQEEIRRASANPRTPRIPSRGKAKGGF